MHVRVPVRGMSSSVMRNNTILIAIHKGGNKEIFRIKHDLHERETDSVKYVKKGKENKKNSTTPIEQKKTQIQKEVVVDNRLLRDKRFE